MKIIANKSGFTYIFVLTVVMIMGISLGMVGQSWKTLMQREREKELLFRGSQIKEAIENWYNPNYSIDGVKSNATRPLLDLKDLLSSPYTTKPLRYLPQSYETKLDGNSRNCAPDCATLKVYQDPMTGKEWTIIRGNVKNGQAVEVGSSVPGAGIIGVASKSDEEPFKTNFKDTALENMGVPVPGSTTPVAGTVAFVNRTGAAISSPGLGKMTKYSEWKFVSESPQKNDHKKIYRAYHESW